MREEAVYHEYPFETMLKLMSIRNRKLFKYYIIILPFYLLKLL